MTSTDFPEMVTLASLTEPRPFRDHTANLGGFVGIRVDGRLAAMAGQRLAPTGFAEVSAVCTHPDFRGRGYAQALVAAVTRNIHSEGRIPFLTSFAANTELFASISRWALSIVALSNWQSSSRHHLLNSHCEGGKLI
jgi:predicted GNAT family acetyltransferase